MLELFFYMNPVLIAAAVIPAILLLIYVYKADKLEKESPGLLFSLVVYGVLSTFLAQLGEQVGDGILTALEPSVVLYNILFFFGVVAFAEEGFKYLVLKLRTWKSPEFDCQFDGVVYAVFVALGFALWENIGYVLSYGFGTALIRAVTAVPGHACFGVFMGVMYGLAKRYALAGEERKSKMYRRLAVILPALLHGTYDFIATMHEDGISWIFVVFVIAVFLWAFLLVRKTARKDRYL